MRRFCTWSSSAALFKSKMPCSASCMSMTNFLVRRPRELSYLQLPLPGVWEGVAPPVFGLPPRPPFPVGVTCLLPFLPPLPPTLRGVCCKWPLTPLEPPTPFVLMVADSCFTRLLPLPLAPFAPCAAPFAPPFLSPAAASPLVPLAPLAVALPTAAASPFVAVELAAPFLLLEAAEGIFSTSLARPRSPPTTLAQISSGSSSTQPTPRLRSLAQRGKTKKRTSFRGLLSESLTRSKGCALPGPAPLR
mmetsp:Transcript_9662/g.24752  ORF Transcript_9662/g.24752 Transcript_9662/m.24752 type:complete len:247 (+) Transcript_9662:1084-1824(+)